MQSAAKAQALVRDIADKLSKRLAIGPGINSLRLVNDSVGWPMIIMSRNGSEVSGAPAIILRIRNVDMVSRDVFNGSTFAYAPHILEIGYELSLAAYNLAVSSSNATLGAVYSNNGFNYTVASTIASGTSLFLQTPGGAPLASGTLTKVSGTGDNSIAYSASALFAAAAQLPARNDWMSVESEATKTGCRVQLKEIAAGTAVSEAALNAAVVVSDYEDLYWPTKSV